MPPPVKQHFTVVGMIAVSAMVYVAQQVADEAIVRNFAAVPAVVGRAWDTLLGGRFDGGVLHALCRLLTAVFLHGGAEHIVYNMAFLWAFGTLASRHLGPWWALAVGLTTGTCGNLAQVVMNLESPIPILGASGAVCGFEGLYLGLALRWRLRWPDVWPLAQPIPPLQLAAVGVLGFLFDAYSLMNHNQGVAYAAHIGGLAAGFLLAGVVTTLFPTESAFSRWRN